MRAIQGEGELIGVAIPPARSPHRSLSGCSRSVACPTSSRRSKPDGTPRKVLDVSRLRNLGWSPTYDLDAGIRSTYDWFVAEQVNRGELRGMRSAPETV